MKIAIVILNWNGKKLLQQFLPSVITHSPNAEIYIADNASTDDSITFLKTNYPQIHVIQNPKNYGFAKGYNEALKHIEADIFCLLNSDVEVTKNWLSPIIDAFTAQKEVVIIQPKIKSYHQKTHFEYAGAAGGFIDKYGYPFCSGRIFNTLEEDNKQYDDTKEIFWASGACFFIRSDVFWQLNGFDEDYFAHQEEIDLCWNAQNNDFKILYVGKSTIYHVGGATLKANNPKKTYLNFRNSLFTLTKNLPKGKLFTTIFMRLFLDGIAGFRFLLQLKIVHVFAILKAHIHFYLNFRKFLKKRNIKTSKNNYYKVRSIIWLYFFKRKKYFTDLIKY